MRSQEWLEHNNLYCIRFIEGTLNNYQIILVKQL